MMKSKSLLLSISAAATLGLSAQALASNSNLLQTEKIDNGYSHGQVMKLAEGKCGEVNCGANKNKSTQAPADDNKALDTDNKALDADKPIPAETPATDQAPKAESAGDN